MPMLAVLPWQLPAGVVRWLRRGSVLAGFAAVFWVCTFHIMDRDFWWHITAGDIMLHTHRIPVTDPFAFTRAGEPYLATHEWLAQIVLALVFQVSGSTGIILLRGIVALLSVGLLLLLNRARSFPNILLAVWAVVIAKGSFLERPQLFTFVFFSAFLLLAFRFLDAESQRQRLRICMAFVAMELLWVNMHGAAALLGCGIVSFLFLQSALAVRRAEGAGKRALLLLFATLAAMAVVLVLPPNGFGTLRYLQSLLSDQTIQYIAEWRPRDWPVYFADLWLFWLLAGIALLAGRRHLFFNGLLLIMAAYLSRQAFRHEVLFILAALATCFYQLKHSKPWDRLCGWMALRSGMVAVATVCVLILLGRAAAERSWNFEQPDHLFGFGQFDLARGAYDFIERENVTGNMFNTYGIGGYLIYRGYPDRKVFIDGRNVDYGMDFMTRTYAAGVNSAVWEDLVERYGITYALIDYDAIREENRLPYSAILDRNPEWPLVYLDDWVAVYVRDIPENRNVIDGFRYKFLTATDIQFHSGFEHVDEEEIDAVKDELYRMRRENPEGVKATLALAKLALRQESSGEARSLAGDAIRVRPFAPEPYAILAAAYVGEQRWKEAAGAYGKLLAYAGKNYPDINYEFIANVYEKVGRTWKARWLRRKAPPSAERDAVEETGSTAATETGAAVLANPALDAVEFNEQGIQAAEQGSAGEAERAFRTAVMLNPGYAEAWNNLCALHLSQFRAADAIPACERAIVLQDDYADAHYNLALAYYREGSMEQAEREALQARKFGRQQEGDELLLLIRRNAM